MGQPLPNKPAEEQTIQPVQPVVPAQTQQQAKQWLLFCAKCQADTPHTAVVDGNGEYVFTCTAKDADGNPCDRFIKLPSDITDEAADVYFDEHKANSSGQVSLEKQEAKLLTLLGTRQIKPQGVPAE